MRPRIIDLIAETYQYSDRAVIPAEGDLTLSMERDPVDWDIS
jgi:hypothetical protein